MCGRYVITEPPYSSDSLTKRYGVLIRELGIFTYNAAPTDSLPVFRVTGKEPAGAFVPMRWGLIPSWTKNPNNGAKMINARAETVVEKPAFRKAFSKRRCLVPMSGFYEWKKSRRDKVPHYVRLINSDLFTCAGLWEWWKSPDREWVASFTIIVTDANALLSPLHERMPVILAPEDHQAWLDPKNEDVCGLARLLKPYPADEMTAYPVTRKVNDVKNDGPELIEPAR
jgi:putative SOS response-associated peptidase YedK